MAINLEFVNHDKTFRSLKTKPIMVNDFQLDSTEDIERFKTFIQTTYDSDSLEIHPRCNCEKLKGAEFIDTICDVCNTPCLPITERPLESVLWLRAPDRVETLINPVMWHIMDRYFTKNDVSILKWLTDPRYKPHKRIPPIIKLEDLNVPRGINYFYHHFDELIDLLIRQRVFAHHAIKHRQRFLEFLEENREFIFSEHLPVPSKLVFITEKTSIGRFADLSIKLAIDAVTSINHVHNNMEHRSLADVESYTVQSIAKLSEYYLTFFKKNLSPKPGWLRKHVYGTRGHMTFRAVITSIHEPHCYNELHLPWSLSVMLFKEHIKSKLLKRGYTPNETLAYITQYTRKYDSIMNDIFQELLAESYKPGVLPVAFQRNPTLTRGSAQQLDVTRIKTDVDDNTVSLSVLVLASLNKSCCFWGKPQSNNLSNCWELSLRQSAAKVPKGDNVQRPSKPPTA